MNSHYALSALASLNGFSLGRWPRLLHYAPSALSGPSFDTGVNAWATEKSFKLAAAEFQPEVIAQAAIDTAKKNSELSKRLGISQLGDHKNTGPWR